MKNNISDIFKDKAHLLDEMPSSTTWQIVRSKLDKRRKNSILLRALNIGLAIAASALIVVNMLWILGGLSQNGVTNEIVNLEEFKPSPWSVYNEIPQHQVINVTNTNNDFVNTSPKSVVSSSWQYMDTSSKNINKLSAITGTWLLPKWHQMDNSDDVPSIMKIFHTNDQRYYLHLNEIPNEAYLLQATDKADKFKVLHPKINYIDNSNNTVLIVYLENGLIIDYRKAKEGLIAI